MEIVNNLTILAFSGAFFLAGGLSPIGSLLGYNSPLIGVSSAILGALVGAIEIRKIRKRIEVARQKAVEDSVIWNEGFAPDFGG